MCGDSLTCHIHVLIDLWTEGLSDQMHNLTDRDTRTAVIIG